MNSVSFVNDWKPVGHESCKRMQDEGMSAVIAGPGVYNEDLYRKAQEAGVSVVGGVSRAVGATGGEWRAWPLEWWSAGNACTNSAEWRLTFHFDFLSSISTSLVCVSRLRARRWPWPFEPQDGLGH